MKITIESTTQLAEVNGLPTRIWEGTTETGIPVICLITRVAVSNDETPAVHEQFKQELLECKPPSAAVEAFPVRMII